MQWNILKKLSAALLLLLLLLLLLSVPVYPSYFPE